MTGKPSDDSGLPADLPQGKRPIRSFVVRGGRLTDGQERAIALHRQDYVIEYQPAVLDFDSIFSRKAELVVEIGFGMGDSLLEMAIHHPQLNYLGIEVHRPGIGKLLQGIVQAGITNLRIINHDASEVLAHCFQDHGIHTVQIFFPDPWHKKRHHKRRLIQPNFVSLLAQKLKPGGRLHLATDWEPYALQMLEVVNSCPSLRNLSPDHTYIATTDRPVTKFERRGTRLGHGVWDLVAEKTDQTAVTSRNGVRVP
ncbi:MAG: tRNA (guanosine(46)-N7)-methyltransferase TrmB [Pseudohongiellaceae bacterium]